jgi:hypothetical protein
MGTIPGPENGRRFLRRPHIWRRFRVHFPGTKPVPPISRACAQVRRTCQGNPRAPNNKSSACRREDKHAEGAETPQPKSHDETITQLPGTSADAPNRPAPLAHLRPHGGRPNKQSAQHPLPLQSCPP